MASCIKGIAAGVKDLLRDIAQASWILFKIFIPIAIVTHLLEVAGLIQYHTLGDLSEPEWTHKYC